MKVPRRREESSPGRTLGYTALGFLVGLAALIAIQFPEIRRYLKMTRM